MPKLPRNAWTLSATALAAAALALAGSLALLTPHGTAQTPAAADDVGETAADEPPSTRDERHWRETFFTHVPPGWQAFEDDFSASSSASPDGVPAHAVLMRSPAGSQVLVSFIDGAAVRLALGSLSLEELVTSYVDGYHLVLGHPVARSEPWACRLDVPGLTPVTGRRIYTRPLGPPDPDDARALERNELGPYWICAARITKSGAFVLVQGWTAEGHSLEPDRFVAELQSVLDHTGARLASR